MLPTRAGMDLGWMIAALAVVGSIIAFATRRPRGSKEKEADLAKILDKKAPKKKAKKGKRHGR